MPTGVYIRKKLTTDKLCQTCGGYKPRTLENFKFKTNGKMATGRCRKCQYEKDREVILVRARKRYLLNQEQLIAKAAARYNANRDSILARERVKRQSNPDHSRRNLLARIKRATTRESPGARLNAAMSERIRFALREQKLGQRWVSLVGYDCASLMGHLERQFRQGMTWDNYGDGWHVDHIQPLKSFNVTHTGDDEFRACWALTNLRPLWKRQNLQKGAKMEFLL